MTKKEKKITSTTIWRFCTSKKLALGLIILLAILSTIGMIIPQKLYNSQVYSQWAMNNNQISSFVEKLKLNEIFKSYIFLSVSLVFTLNLVFCTIEQIRRAIKISRIDNSNFKITKFPNEAEIKLSQNLYNVKKEIINLLTQKRYKVSEEENKIMADKGRFGIWGAVIFHIGLIVVILGGLISNYFSMSGYFQISEGETFQETHKGYIPQSLQEAPLFDESTGHIGYNIKLDKQERIFKGRRLDFTRSHLELGGKDGVLDSKAVLERGTPIEYKGLTFYHKDTGYSPELSFRQNGKDIGSTYFSVQTTEIGKSYHYTFNGELSIFQEEGYIIKVSYYPDLVVKENNKYDYDSMEVKNPAINVKVFKNGKEIFDGLVKKNQWIKFNNYELSLGNTIYWVGIDVVKDPGANILFIGFYISLIGLIILYSIVPKRVFVELKEDNFGTICVLSGRSRKYQLFFKDEFDEIVKKIGDIKGEK